MATAMTPASKLKVEPSPDIIFTVVGGKPNPCPLQLTNTGTGFVAFKVKTTAPKKYCVRPNAGVIPSGKQVEVHVIPQVVKSSDPSLANDLSGKCKDKFMIQSTSVEAEAAPTTEFWASVDPAQLQQTLLRCKYKVRARAPARSLARSLDDWLAAGRWPARRLARSHDGPRESWAARPRMRATRARTSGHALAGMAAAISAAETWDAPGARVRGAGTKRGLEGREGGDEQEQEQEEERGEG
jgi:hypothetical protein